MNNTEDKLENNRQKYIDYTFKRHGIDPDSKEGQLIYYAYGHGYFQAKKDLSDISWIKEVSGVKEMSRAKEEALKAYPPQSIAANYDTIARRDAFEYGYLKAEKDLELTWEDIRKIVIIYENVLNDKDFNTLPIKDGYTEVLKRFKESKEE